MKTIDERLKSKGITKATKFHNYDYLYKSIVEIMQGYENELKAEKNESNKQRLLEEEITNIKNKN